MSSFASCCPRLTSQAANQYILNNSYGPLLRSLPISLAHLSYGMPKEDGHEGSQIGDDEDMPIPQHDNSSSEHLSPSPPGERMSNETANGSPAGANGLKSTSTQPTAPVARHNGDAFEMAKLSEKPQRPQAKENTQEEDEAKTEADFAKPGGRGARRPQREDGADPKAFLHPATKDPQRILWLPRDALGLADAQVAENTAAGVESTTRNAIFNSQVRSCA